MPIGANADIKQLHKVYVYAQMYIQPDITLMKKAGYLRKVLLRKVIYR